MSQEAPKIRIVVDAMGGDFAPDVNVKGSLEALRDLEHLEITLVGIQSILEEKLSGVPESQRERLTILHAEDVISMDDHAGKAIRQKKKSSIHVGLQEVKEKRADAFISAGNSGAVMAGALLRLGRLSGVERPAIIIKLPTAEGHSIVLDVGANVDSKTSHLVQFAEMGRIYAEVLESVTSPRVGLLSNASESHKGNEVTREVDAILREKPGLNYQGYVEGNDLFKGTVDVVVCDGFVGNIVLKTAEGFASTVREWFARQVKSDVLGMLGILFMSRLIRKFKNKFNYEPSGAAPLLGINGLVLISHGGSSALAIQNGISTAVRAVEADLVAKLESQLDWTSKKVTESTNRDGDGDKENDNTMENRGE